MKARTFCFCLESVFFFSTGGSFWRPSVLVLLNCTELILREVSNNYLHWEKWREQNIINTVLTVRMSKSESKRENATQYWKAAICTEHNVKKKKIIKRQHSSLDRNELMLSISFVLLWLQFYSVQLQYWWACNKQKTNVNVTSVWIMHLEYDAHNRWEQHNLMQYDTPPSRPVLGENKGIWTLAPDSQT